MREFFLLPAVLVAGLAVGTLLLFIMLFVIFPTIIIFGVVLLIGERQGWARMGGLYRDDDEPWFG
ncbi:hypothetical protein [Sphingomonas mucosissima]|uniref:Uncharacterized protein n=1 Tax=Sphingomonas mucosissima TaxID=370959 RepID=A0A245ZDZ6_9SPHN|nr:hypothetical protein [Sphingomonas mucosissima]OWK27981.1 hypothetical protein SPMU_32260 [Sphingomonas mucosissima]